MARPRSARRSIPAPETSLPGRRWDVLTSLIPGLRAALEQQRRFRREQLAVLDANGGTQECPAGAGVSDGRDQEAVQVMREVAMREVDAIVADGARRALADIELALVRMDTGRYGHCRSCGARIPLVVLEAIPKTTLCLACQGGSERGADQPRGDQRSPAASRVELAPARREATRRQRRRRRAVDATAGRTQPLSGTR